VESDFSGASWVKYIGDDGGGITESQAITIALIYG
jgi:hypothetical protein